MPSALKVKLHGTTSCPFCKKEGYEVRLFGLKPLCKHEEEQKENARVEAARLRERDEEERQDALRAVERLLHEEQLQQQQETQRSPPQLAEEQQHERVQSPTQQEKALHSQLEERVECHQAGEQTKESEDGASQPARSSLVCEQHLDTHVEHAAEQEQSILQHEEAMLEQDGSAGYLERMADFVPEQIGHLTGLQLSIGDIDDINEVMMEQVSQYCLWFSKDVLSTTNGLNPRLRKLPHWILHAPMKKAKTGHTPDMSSH